MDERYRSQLYQGIEQPGPLESRLWLVYFAWMAFVLATALVSWLVPPVGDVMTRILLFPVQLVFDH